MESVRSPFIDLPFKSTIELNKTVKEEVTTLAVSHACYVPPWTECPTGYECVNYNFAWLYPLGKKVGWTCDGGLITDPGLHKYKIRIVMDIALLYWYTVTSKVLFGGNYVINISHAWNPELDFGTPTSPVATCGGLWKGVNNETIYSSSVGYGWSDTTNLYSIDRGGDCYPWRDFVLSTSDHTFNIDVNNGNYSVVLYIGDESHPHDFIDVYAEGILKVDNLNYSYDPNQGTYKPESVTFTIEITDGQLNLRFHDDGGSDPYWIINALKIKRIDPVDEVTEMTSSLDFNYSSPGSAYVFEPSYVYGNDTIYLNCAIMWLNFTQTDMISIGIPIEYKTYITDLNRDDHIDIYDAIILSNEFGNSWGSPGDPVDPNDYTWRADINSDGTVNTLDAIILKNQFGTDYIKPQLEGSLLDIWEPMWENTLNCMP